MTGGAAVRWLERLHQDDRQLFLRWALGDQHRRMVRWLWIGITHLGGAVVMIATALAIPLVLFPGHPGAWYPALALTVSHVVVQLVKRLVQRNRPPRTPVIACPDRFSFPSGHAASSLAIALSLAVVAPAAAVPLVGLGLLIGCSRVVLGVHYPGDVLAGQMIAVVTVLVLVG